VTKKRRRTRVTKPKSKEKLEDSKITVREGRGAGVEKDAGNREKRFFVVGGKGENPNTDCVRE